MAKGRLNLTEKYAIQGMVANNKSITDIASELGRSESVVQNYIDNELDRLIETITTIQEPTLDNKIIKAVLEQLAPTGRKADKEDAKEKLNRLISTMKPQEINTLNGWLEQPNGIDRAINIMVSSVLKLQNAQDLMIRRTSEKHKSGVAIMTKEASERGDENRKQKRSSRRLRANIFEPKRNTIK
jgi:IS30 family transposase